MTATPPRCSSCSPRAGATGGGPGVRAGGARGRQAHPPARRRAPGRDPRVLARDREPRQHGRGWDAGEDRAHRPRLGDSAPDSRRPPQGGPGVRRHRRHRRRCRSRSTSPAPPGWPSKPARLEGGDPAGRILAHVERLAAARREGSPVQRPTSGVGTGAADGHSLRRCVLPGGRSSPRWPWHATRGGMGGPGPQGGGPAQVPGATPARAAGRCLRVSSTSVPV